MSNNMGKHEVLCHSRIDGVVNNSRLEHRVIYIHKHKPLCPMYVRSMGHELPIVFENGRYTYYVDCTTIPVYHGGVL